MNEKELYIVYPTYSHYISVVPLIQKSDKTASEIWISGTSQNKAVIQNLNAQFLELPYYQSYHILNFKYFIQILINNLTSKKFTRDRYREFLRFVTTMREKVKNGNFKRIYIDSHLSYYYIFLKDFEIDIFFFNTKLSTLKSRAVPPLSTKVVWKRNYIYNLWAELLWWCCYLTTYLYNLSYYVCMLGWDDYTLFKRYLYKKHEKITDYLLPNYCSYIHFEINYKKTNSKIYICGNKVLEYPWKILKPIEEYLNIEHTYDQISYNTENSSLKIFMENYVKAKKVNKELVMLYCSLGTLTKRFKNRCIQFYQKLFEVIARNPNYYLVISDGSNNHEIAMTQTFSNRIYTTTFVNQIYILKLSNLMLSHGGLNSIQESISFNVPLIVYPLNRRVDQNGNAARVKFHGYGDMGNIRRDSVEKIEKKIASLLVQEYHYAKR